MTREDVVATLVMVGTSTALVCSQCARGDREAVEKAKSHKLVRDPALTVPAATSEVLDVHPEAEGACDVCGRELLGGG